MIKIGILGTGDISHAFMNALPESDGVVQAVYHRELPKARRFAEQYGIPQAFDDMEDLAGSGVECIYNALPNSLHFKTSLICIQAGLDILIEKPVTSNPREFDTIVARASECGVYAIEVNRVALQSNFEFIRSRLNELGESVLIDISFCKQSRRYEQLINGGKPNVFSAEFSGGALYDLGVYGVHFVYGLLGEPAAVDYRCLRLGTDVDVAGAMIIFYPNCIAEIHLSKISNGGSYTVLHGPDGEIVSRFPPSKLHEVSLRRQNKTEELSQQAEDGLKAFVKNALRIIKDRDDSEYARLTCQSARVAAIMEYARRQCGIVFAADK